ncbi:MAG: AAA family ATPase, partial [Deltaproteobacteria bacterium]
MANGFIISVLGGKGGVGKSTFAVNYALAASIDSKSKVLLIDLDPKACGDLGMLLGIKPKRTLMELGSQEGKLDANALQSYVAVHPSGVHYIPSVLEPEQMAVLEPNQ